MLRCGGNENENKMFVTKNNLVEQNKTLHMFLIAVITHLNDARCEYEANIFVVSEGVTN